MACGCGKSNRESARVPTRNPGIANFNSTPQKTTDTIANITSVNANRMTALNQKKAEVEAKYMNPERLRIERIRRDAIRNALGKQ